MKTANIKEVDCCMICKFRDIENDYIDGTYCKLINKYIKLNSCCDYFKSKRNISWME